MLKDPPCKNREKLPEGNRDHRGRYGQKLFGMGGNVLCLDWDGNCTSAYMQQDFKLDTSDLHFTVSNYINNYLQNLQRKRERSWEKDLQKWKGQERRVGGI